MANVRNKAKMSGFQLAGIEQKKRLVMCTEAMPGCGKTNFGLSMPGPLAIINLDEGLDGVIQEYQETKEIYVASHRANLNEIRAMKGDSGNIKKAAEDEWRAIRQDYIEALADAKSVFVDTGTEFNEMLRLAHFGKLTQVMPHHYAAPNKEMKQLIDLAYDSNANVLFSHRLKKEYVNDKATANLELAGWGQMPYEVQVHMRQWKDPKESFPDRFHMTVLKCRLKSGVEQEGEDFSGEMVTFPFIAALLTNTNPDEWE